MEKRMKVVLGRFFSLIPGRGGPSSLRKRISIFEASSNIKAGRHSLSTATMVVTTHDRTIHSLHYIRSGDNS